MYYRAQTLKGMLTNEDKNNETFVKANASKTLPSNVNNYINRNEDAHTFKEVRANNLLLTRQYVLLVFI